MKTMDKFELWIGLFHGFPNNNFNKNFPDVGDIAGCYVNAVAQSKSSVSFIKLVKFELLTEGICVLEASEVDTMENYKIQGRIGKEIERAINELNNEYPVSYGDFHFYD